MMSAGRCVAVMYHYVRDDHECRGNGNTGLSADRFQGQLDHLCKSSDPIDWPTFIAWRAGRCPIPDRSFLLSFDDGLADHHRVVSSILERRGLRAVFFVQTQSLVERRPLPAHQIHALINNLGAVDLKIAVDRQLDQTDPTWRRRFPFDPRHAERIYHYESPDVAHSKHLLTNILPIDLRNRLLDELFAKHVGDAGEFAGQWYMTREQLAELQDAGHTIGGHGHRHEPYDRLPVAEQARDMVECAAVLTEQLGPMPRPFSYPYGRYNEHIARRCAYAGFVNGFTTETGWIGPFDDAHRLRRVDTIAVDAFLEKEFACIPQ